MALTKALKEKIISRHNEMFEAFLRGDIEGFTAWWTDDIVIYGTAISEVFTSKQVAFDFYKSTSDQVTGLVKMENKKINVHEQDGYLILTEESDFHVKIGDEWMFYHHSRLTGVWSEINGEWYTTHVHISYPDGYSSEGQQINPEQLRSENIKLLAAVEERTAELAQKNRELEIEIALDKIRTRSLSMHHSNEILEVAYLVSEKLKELSLGIDAVAILLLHEDHYEYWIANDEGAYTTKIIDDKIHANPSAIARNFYTYSQKAEDFTKCYSGDEKRKHWEYLFTNTGFSIVPEERKAFILAQSYYNICVSFHDSISLAIVRYNDRDYSEAEQSIVKKFCKVFAQAYTRFMDLYTAEKQAKEARIEAALEKVRSRSLIMRSSDELSEVVKTVFDNLRDLEFNLSDSAVVINLFQEDSDDIVQWITDNEQTYPRSFRHPHFDNPILNDIKSARKKGLDYFSATYSFEDKNAFWNYYFEHTDFSRFPDHIKQDILQRRSYAQSMALQQFTGILFPNIEGRVLDNEEGQILKRFSIVFEQAYIRFLDLKKAEEQAREAQIEAALEKVRSVSLSMQKSEDLPIVVETVEEKLLELGLKVSGGISITIFVEGTKDFLNCLLMLDRKEKATFYYQNYFDTQAFRDFYEARANGETYINKVYNEVDSREHIDSILAQESFQQADYEVRQWMQSKDVYAYAAALMKYTGLFVFYFDREYLSQDFASILKRFANAFEQAYIRFLDLKKAEEQAREAKVEAALERVRSRTMAMQRSEELSAVAHLLFEEFKALYTDAGHVLSRAFVITVDEQTERFTFFITTTDGEYLQTAYPMPFDEPTNGVPLFQCWKNQNDLLVNELEGDVYKLWLNYLDSIHLYVSPEVRQMNKRVNNYARFAKGFIGITSVDKLTDLGLSILQRFTKVFDQTYTRFLDLQVAEANKKSAVKQAAIDRIRADIASMRSVEDLDRVIPLIWNELHTLQIPFLRCGIFIMNEQEQTINTFLSTPDGKSIASFPLSYQASDNINDVVSHWQRGELYINQWSIDAFHSLADSLLERNIIEHREQYLASIPDKGMYLHFVPFLQGMLYVGNAETLSEEELDVLQSVSNAFSTAYARYQDFSNLEAAKKEIEKTLQDLKQTQQQLIQVEKMASLGELTAGIAHEIQNPLNFVNNFSEVSQELMDEMKVEIANGNYKDADQLATDIKENLNKIHHHGKRADAIVKGMLQHSRTSSGKKELADINTLCDEYLRLAYHGLRAKEKNFNIKFETKFDVTIGLIELIPQDIGRVLLNLINNAFYATDERKKKDEPGYEPIVKVTTEKSNDSIRISVIDNGLGIPDSIKEKIFQPFFTTKPTGQGTGLGLSLSYDIITKGHGGELQCTSKYLSDESAMTQAGTVFTIILPYKYS